MIHLLNILAGMGQVVDVFAPHAHYVYPKRGDRAQDLQNIGRDAHGVVQRLDGVAARELKRLKRSEEGAQDHGKVNHCTAAQ